MSGITFSAIFNKATTTIDGGWVVSFQVSQDEAKQIMQISEMRQSVLQVAVVPVDAITLSGAPESDMSDSLSLPSLPPL